MIQPETESSDNPLTQDNEDVVVPDEKGSASRQLSHEIRDYVRHIESFRASFPFSMGALAATHNHFQSIMNKFLDEKGLPVEGHQGRFEIPNEHLSEFKKIERHTDNFSIAVKTVSRSLMVALVSQYDAYLGGLLKSLFYLKPEILSSSERKLTFAELNDFGDVDKAKEFIIEKEIESILRKSHTEQFDWMEAKFSLPLRKNLSIWPVFIEVTERRNLFVHTNGVVSSQYLKVCRDHSVILSPDLSLGDTLDVSRKYFVDATLCLLEIGVKLGQVLWRKLAPEDAAKADSDLINITYDLLRERRYKEAKILLDFAIETLKPFISSDQNLKVFIINRAQAYKWSGDADKAKAIIQEVDWSACSSDFRLAEAVLDDRFQEAADLMLNIGADGPVGKLDYRDWPLFRDFRKTDEFLTTFEKIFGEKYALQASQETVETNPALLVAEIDSTETPEN